MRDKALRHCLEKNYGLHIRRMTPIKRGMLNRNYRIKATQGDFLFKGYMLRPPREVAYELAALEILRQANFPSPQIVKSCSGDLQINCHGKPGVLFKFIPGQPAKRLDLEELKRVGAQLAKMHVLLRTARLPAVKRNKFTDGGYPDVLKLIRTRRHEIERKGFPHGAAMVEFLAREFFRLKPHEGLPQGVTHQDVKPDNIIRDGRGNLSFIDFDNTYRGVLLTDLGTPIIWTCFPGGKLDPRRIKALVRGYESVRKLTRMERKMFAEVIKFRLLREAFAWPLRFAPAKAIKNNSRFLAAYRDFVRFPQIGKMLWKT